MKILDGKKISQQIKEQLKEDILKMKTAPGLAVIIAGDDAASRIYVNLKKKACQQIGIYSEQYDLPANVSQQELLELINRLNHDGKINGILVQLPLPPHIDQQIIINAIDPGKDVDVFHPVNAGKIMLGNAELVPCTPAGIMELIKASGISPQGKECVVVGRSNIVGKPLSMLLLKQNGTVTICHSATKNLAEVCRRADILVAAVGRPEFITANMVKEGAVVIDVGINRLADNKVVGDVDFEQVYPKAGAITPVPGGVGPMTIAMLMKNTLTAQRNQQ